MSILKKKILLYRNIYKEQKNGRLKQMELKKRLTILENLHLSQVPFEDPNLFKLVRQAYCSCIQDLLFFNDIEIAIGSKDEVFLPLLESLELYIKEEERKLIETSNEQELREVFDRVDEAIIPLWCKAREHIMPLEL